MNIDIEHFFKLQRGAITEAKEKSAYYTGYIQALHDAESMISASRTDKCEKVDPLRNQKLRIHYTPNKEDLNND